MCLEVKMQQPRWLVYKLMLLVHFPRGIFLDLRVSVHFYLLGHILGLGALGHFGLKSQTRKFDNIHKDLELYQVYIC